ncbi:DUF2306 domain-containing protein, partial [Fulvivirga sp.]
MRLGIKVSLLLILSFFTFLMVRLTIPYFSFNDQTAFLRIKQWIIHNEIWKVAFYIHVITSCICLMAGFTQFSKTLLFKYPKIHKTAGWVYVGVILLLSGPSGIIMSIYANGGLISQTSFLILSVLWIYFTYQGFNQARKFNFLAHRNFIIRSYALTLSALTLRAWKVALVFFFRPHPMDVYMLVAWLGWIP